MAKITIDITSDFHNTSTTVRIDRDGQTIGDSTARRIDRDLCGVSGCLCGGIVTAHVSNGYYIASQYVKPKYYGPQRLRNSEFAILPPDR